MKYNPFSIAILTFFIALGLMYSIASIASAQEYYVWKSPFFEKDGDFSDACFTLSFCVSLESLNNNNSTSDWASFIYSSSTRTTIDSIDFLSTGDTDERARWEVYQTNNITTLGDLIAYTDWFTPRQTPIGTSTITQYEYFNTPIDVGGGYYYRFLLKSEVGSGVGFYLKSRNAEPNTSIAKYTWGSKCLNTQDPADCTFTYDIWTPSGTSTPAVALSYRGSPTNEEYITTTNPCSTHSQTRKTNSCNVPTATSTSVGGFVNTVTTNKKVSIYLKDKFFKTIDSVAFYYPEATYSTFEHTFTDLQASTTYQIQTCLSDAQAFPDFAETPLCTNIIFTNGDNPVDVDSVWCELFPQDPNCKENATSTTIWKDLGCDDIGITDVKKGVQCALVWAFEPSQNSLEMFYRAKDALLYSIPLGYATYMVQDVKTAFTSTSTNVFTRDIELGKYFGKPNTATTTISLEGFTSYFSMLNPVFDLIETILWLMFAVWFIYWAMTRQL